MSSYSEKIDKIVFGDLKLLGWEAKNFALVLLFVPAHMCWLLFRIMFPWLIPLLTKEDT
jgi:hypothetical protein